MGDQRFVDFGQNRRDTTCVQRAWRRGKRRRDRDGVEGTDVEDGALSRAHYACIKNSLDTGFFRVRIAERQTLYRLRGDVVQTRHAGTPRSRERAVQLVCRVTVNKKYKYKNKYKNNKKLTDVSVDIGQMYACRNNNNITTHIRSMKSYEQKFRLETLI